MAVTALLGWTTLLAGGVYPWVWIPALVATIALAWRTRAQAAEFAERPLNLMLGFVAAVIVVQVIPLPVAVIDRIDPHAASVREALWPAAVNAGHRSMPISIIPAQTVAAFCIFLAGVLLFQSVRRVCETSGIGRLVRAVAVIGIVASIAAIAQRAGSRELLYGFWRPLDPGARPYGPFVNRNHFATWAIMACPLILGYLLARTPTSNRLRPWSQRVADAAKNLGSFRIWLVCAICLLTLAVILSASRSGVIGLAVAFVVGIVLARDHYRSRKKRWLAVQAIPLSLAIVTFTNIDPLLNRLNETLTVAAVDRGRSAIWRDTVRLIDDFRWTGTGAGTYGAAIVPYQTAEPEYSIGQAHNHYLQILAEGGLLVAVPAALAGVSFLLLFRRRLSEAAGTDALIRAGAFAGIAGVMAQSIWETGLRMPANALLFSLLAAVAVHRPPRADHR